MTKIAGVLWQNKMLVLTGELDFANVMPVYQQSLPYLNEVNAWEIDFSQLKNSNSAGIALMIEWIKLAKQENKLIKFKQVPAKLLSIAKASGLDQWLLGNLDSKEFLR